MRSGFVLIVLIILAIDQIVLSDKYPYIGECDLDKNTNTLTFICAKSRKADRTKQLFNRFGITKCFNSKPFENEVIEAIHFQSCNFPEMRNDIFVYFNNVQKLNVSNIELHTLNPEYFVGSKNLSEFIASHNIIIDVPAFLFRLTQTMNIVDLSHNRIHHIDRNAFIGANELKWLDLSYNRLTALNDTLFENLQHLTHLDLSGNPIETINKGTFANMKQLQYLNLSHTSLTNIAPDTFSSLNNLQKLDLSYNDLKKLNANILPWKPNKLKWLVIGNDQLNKMRGFTKDRIPNMEIVNIDQN